MNNRIVHKVVQGTETRTWCGAASYNVAKQWKAVTCPKCLEGCYKHYDRFSKPKTLPADPDDPAVLAKVKAFFGDR